MHPSSRLAGLTELSGVRMLWFSGWYDGPVTGLAQHNDRECWFVMVTDDSRLRGRGPSRLPAHAPVPCLR
jgi:hypothetical protein